MADNLATVCFKGLVLLFITAVIIFACFFMVLRVERHVASSELKRLGALRYTPEGDPNYWYFFVRDMPKICRLMSLTYLEDPKIERTDKGFKVHGKDYEITFERVSRAETESDDVNATAETLNEQPNPDYTVTFAKGKTYYWKKPTESRLGEKNGERYQPPAGNTITAADGTLKQ